MEHAAWAWGVGRRALSRSFRLHWPPAASHSAEPVGIARPWLSARLPLGTLALFAPAPAVSGLSSCDSRLCFDSKLALFGDFWGVSVVREALPDAIALCRLACRVRTFVGQDSILVVRRVINDTSGIVSHDGPKIPSVIGSLFCSSLQPPACTSHCSSPIFSSPPAPGTRLRYLAFVICICRPHPTSVTRLFCFSIPHPKIRNPQFPKLFQRSDQLAVPGGLVPPVSLEARAAIQRRAGTARLPRLPRFAHARPAALEPADVPLDDRADEDQRAVSSLGAGAISR